MKSAFRQSQPEVSIPPMLIQNDFIKNQFGTRNRYLQEFSRTELEMGKEPDVEFPVRELKRKINENIRSQGKKNVKISSSAQYEMSILDRSLKRDRAARRRDEIDEGKRMKMLGEMGRWDKFRQQKDQAIQDATRELARQPGFWDVLMNTFSNQFMLDTDPNPIAPPN